jgi:hypothetical protein
MMPTTHTTDPQGPTPKKRTVLERPLSAPRAHPARPLIVVASCLLALAVSACGSTSHSATLLGSKIQQDCTTVSDVLANGPDPDADTIGYAQAQVLPLEQLRISEPNLQAAVKNLAAAYKAYSFSTGTAQDQAAVQTSKAETALNAICPGAAP